MKSERASQRGQFIDHYKALVVKRNATTEEIKKAFRQLTKKYHPDRNADRPEWATERMKSIIEANRVLSSESLRSAYDRQYAIYKASPKPIDASIYRKYVDEAKLEAEKILNDLLAGREIQAIKDYEALQEKTAGYDLSGHLELRDWVDGKFLIAEHYQKRRKHLKALAIYEELFHSGAAGLRYGHLAEEVRDRIIRIYSRDLAPAAPSAQAAEYYLCALGLETSRSRRAFLHKKIAECHLEMGDLVAARKQLDIALELKADIKGATKLFHRLGIVPTNPT